MRSARLAITAAFALSLVPFALLPMAGCDGKGADGQTAQVDPEFKAKTNAMLNQMSKDAMTKYKKAPSKR